MAQPETEKRKIMGSLLLEQSQALSRERNLDLPIVLQAVEKALAKVFESKYGNDHAIRVSLSREGAMRTFITVPQESCDDGEGGKEGVEKEEFLPLPDFDRLAVRTLRKVLNDHLQTADRAIFYEEFKDRVGQIVSGVVRQVGRDMVSVGLGRAEGVIMRKDMIPGEHLSMGSRVKMCIESVKKEGPGPQILLSRTSEKFLEGILAQEIPEIQDGSIEVRAVARDPGSRAKIAVVGHSSRSDVVGACIGTKGNRIRAVSEELCGEKIDVLLWSSDVPSFVVSALSPAEISRVVIEDEKRVRVIVASDQLGIAIGRSGQNVRLAHHLTGINIDIVTEDQHRDQQEKEQSRAVNTFMDALDLDHMMALLLVSEGFETIEDLIDKDVTEEDLACLPGMDAENARELQRRAHEELKKRTSSAVASFLSKGGDQALIDLGLPPQILGPLSEQGILTLKSFSDLSLDDLFGYIGSFQNLLSEEVWGDLIMKGRHLNG